MESLKPLVILGLTLGILLWLIVHDNPTPEPAEFHITVNDTVLCKTMENDTLEFDTDEGKLIVYIAWYPGGVAKWEPPSKEQP